jgi:hypothetical protein
MEAQEPRHIFRRDRRARALHDDSTVDRGEGEHRFPDRSDPGISETTPSKDLAAVEGVGEA